MARAKISSFRSRAILIVAVCTLGGIPAWCGSVLTFEGIHNGEFVGNFYAGVTFNNAQALVAGQSLNAAEFPPASGQTVATNFDSEMNIEFAKPITSFQALFTHTLPITLEFFLGELSVGNASTNFGNNLAISGGAGTFPNEAIKFHNGGGFDLVRVVTTGIYTVDDVSFDTSRAAETVPEPADGLLAAGGLAVILAVGRRRRIARR